MWHSEDSSYQREILYHRFLHYIQGSMLSFTFWENIFLRHRILFYLKPGFLSLRWNSVSSAPEECPILAGCAPPTSCTHSQRSRTPGPHHQHSQTPSSSSHRSNSPSLCWYHRNHADQAQKCCALCSWSENEQAPWQEVAFSLPASSSSSSLGYLQDKLSSCRFLGDSRASVSVFPAPASSSTFGVKLLTADGSSVSCSGSRITPLHFDSYIFDWPFQLALISVPILRWIFAFIIIFFNNVITQQQTRHDNKKKKKHRGHHAFAQSFTA